MLKSAVKGSFSLFSCKSSASVLLRIVPARSIHASSFLLDSEEKRANMLSGKGMVVGCYEGEDGAELTEAGKTLDAKYNNKITHLLKISGQQMKDGDSRLFYDISEDLTHLALVSLGKRAPEEKQEDMLMSRHNVRCAAAAGASLLKKAKVKEIHLEGLSDPEAAAEGTHLALFTYDDMKGKKPTKPTDEKPTDEKPSVLFWDGSSEGERKQWIRGCVLAEGQNFARWLMETPSNHMTPTDFVDAVSRKLGQSSSKDKIEINPRPYSWIKEKKMGSFLSVAQGSDEDPWFLEIKYNGATSSDTNPLVLVGKGITFDSGGICIKPAAGMPEMKADMGGAACVAGTTVAVAMLGLPINIVSLMPLCENMPSGKAIKPGDVVTAMNGKTIEIDNTDAEGRLILADALCYAHSFNPMGIIDMATLTGAVGVALGSGAAGTYTTSESMWGKFHEASRKTGDRLWRMPLYNLYSKQMKSRIADINNLGTLSRSAGSCTAAAFLKAFVECDEWCHLDIAGVMSGGTADLPYLSKGMSGRPTRTIIQYIQQLCS